MRICFDARCVQQHFPGIGRYAIGLVRAMQPLLGEDDELVLLRDPRAASHWDLAAWRGDRVTIWDVPLSPFSLRQQWQLPHLLRRRHVELYHSPYYLMPYRPGVAGVVSIHDLIPLHYPRLFSPAQRLIFALTVRLAVRAATTVIAPSATTAGDLRQRLGVPAERLVTIPLGVDETFRPQSAQEVAAAREPLGLPQGYALYVGSNKPHKNLVRLVEAWAKLRDRVPVLVVAGPWDARFPEARESAAALKLEESVRFLGAVAESRLPALYGGASLFVFPSCYEGFGLPVLEAMACGVPVACSNGGSLPEVVGPAAELFDPSAVDAIAAAVERLLDDPDRRRELSRRGLERAARFRWQGTAAAVVQVYRRVLRRGDEVSG